MTGSGSTLQNELLAARVNPDETKNWERKLFYLLTSALMGDPMRRFPPWADSHEQTTLYSIGANNHFV